jgi:diamine N-acetyltransferase
MFILCKYVFVTAIHCNFYSHISFAQISMLTIRTATSADILTIHQLAHSIWYPTFGAILSPEQIVYMLGVMYDPSALEKQMEQGHIFLMAEVDGRSVGYASYAQKSSETVHIHKIYLLPETQGKGFGRLLLAEIESCARGLGAIALELCVNRYNSARQMYEKIGFIIVREEDFPIGPYWMNDFVMRKEIV